VGKLLNKETTVLLVIDVQGKLAQLMHNKEVLFDNLQRVIKGAKVLDIPIVWIEQNPKGLGPTIPEVAQLLQDYTPVEKYSFSCCGNTSFMEALNTVKRSQVLVTGIETHICVYQTVMDLLALKYEVQVVTDAVSSRTPENKQLALNRMQAAGATLTSAEMALFEVLKMAEGEAFKEILKIVK
jgi:nicotinamidase-related amidase